MYIYIDVSILYVYVYAIIGTYTLIPSETNQTKMDPNKKTS